MGCDIHAHTELKINGVWHHLNHPRLDRWYYMFSRLAGVRNNTDVEFPLRRGMPGDASIITMQNYKCLGSDTHSSSWLSLEEYKQIVMDVAAEVKKNDAEVGFTDRDISSRDYRLRRCWFGSPFSGRDDLEDFGCMFDCKIEDARIVFWFDN